MPGWRTRCSSDEGSLEKRPSERLQEVFVAQSSAGRCLQSARDSLRYFCGHRQILTCGDCWEKKAWTAGARKAVTLEERDNCHENVMIIISWHTFVTGSRKWTWWPDERSFPTWWWNYSFLDQFVVRIITPEIVRGSLNYPKYSCLYLIQSAVLEEVKTSPYYPCITPDQ